jgi:hypothetical protein
VLLLEAAGGGALFSMGLSDVRARKAIVRAQRAAAEALADLTHAYAQTPAGAIYRARDTMSAAVTELGAALREHDEATDVVTERNLK